MRLYSAVLRLINLHPVTVPPEWGQHAHAAFFNIVRQVDPLLSQALHDRNGKGVRQLFTLGPLMGLPRRHGAEIHLREGWECWQRVTLLNEPLFHAFLEYFLGRDGKPASHIRLGDAHFAVAEILVTPGSHPWAGFTTLEELQQRLDEPPPASFGFELHSPTSFSLGDRIETMPYPRLVFRNLATAWHVLTGQDLIQAVEHYAEHHMRLVVHRLQSRRAILHNKPQIGVIGRVEYHFDPPQDTPLARALHLLADLAFYTGLGRKTAQGMGMVRRFYPNGKGEDAYE